jgi:predicted CoA-binding protein
MIDPAQATAFLSAGRIAVVGASDEPKNFGRTIVRALTDHGIDAIAVHPEAISVSGRPCYPDLQSVPGAVDGVIVMVPKSVALEVVQTCMERGVSRVWLFKGSGAGAVSDEAIRFCNDHGMSVVAGACPLMFLEPVRGVHKLHRVLRRANGSLAKTSA